MKILFMGTDRFAVPSLIAIAEKYQVTAVITQPDKPKGRGRKVQPTPVKEEALKMGIPVLQPKSLKSGEIRRELENYTYDMVAVVAYGKLIPPGFLEKPALGCLCLHPSLLPEYRGCSPIEYAILDGKEKTGISIFSVGTEFDTGDVIYQEEVDILPDETGGQLRERLSEISPPVFLKGIELVAEGKATSVSQDSSCANYAPKLEKEDGLIDWSQPVNKIRNRIRAFNPKPGAFTFFRGEMLKIHTAEIFDGGWKGYPGSISAMEKNRGPVVSCGDGNLLLTSVQPAGKNPMSAWSFVLGYKPRPGEVLGAESHNTEGESKNEIIY